MQKDMKEVIIMKIEFIEFKNYRQWKDEKIEFSTSDEKNITVLQGAMGAGKTNILNAISWCLYGKESHLSSKQKGLPILNNISCNNLNIDETETAEVNIQLLDEDQRKLIVGRKAKFRKNKNGECVPVVESSSGYDKDGTAFWVYFQDGRNIKNIEFPVYFLNKIIPESIKEYFFFDGEKITEYFNITSVNKIREAVFKISQINLLENTIEHLTSVDSFLLQSRKDLSGRAEEIRDEIETNKKALKELKEKLEGLNKEYIEAKKKVHEYSVKLSNTDINRINYLQKEKVKVMRRIDEAEGRIGEKKNEFISKLIDTAPTIFAYLPMKEMSRILEKRLEKSGGAGQIPPDINKIFLKKLLDTGKCICSCDLNENEKNRKEIIKLYNGIDEISNISAEIIKENINISNILSSISNFKTEYSKDGKEIKEMEKQIKKDNEELKAIDTEIGNCNVEEVQMWHRRFNEYNDEENKINRDIGRLEYQISEIVNQSARLDTDLEKELRKENKNEVIVQYVIFCKRCIQALTEIKDDIMEEVRREIEEKTKSQFFELIWKKSSYKDVKIDKDYNISVYNRDGLSGLGTLSKGETQVLALSFMAALNKVSGFNSPIVIDTPLGRISKEPKEKIASRLSDYLKGKQVVLLVTDEEYTKEVRKKLYDRVGEEYIIKFIEGKDGDKAEVINYE